MTLFGIEIGITYIVSQLIGFAAMGIGIASYQAKKTVGIITMQTVSNFLWLLQYLLLGSYSAVFANLIGGVRNLIYALRGKYKIAASPIIPVISVILFIIAGVMTYNSPWDILPTAAMITATVAFFIGRERVVRYLSVFVSLGWFAYGASVGSVSSMLADGLCFVSVIASIIRYHVFDKYDESTLH